MKKIMIVLVLAIGLIGTVTAVTFSNILVNTAIITPPLGIGSGEIVLSNNADQVHLGRAPTTQSFTASWTSTDSGDHDFVLFVTRTDGIPITFEDVFIQFNGQDRPPHSIEAGDITAIRWTFPVDATQSGSLAISIRFMTAGGYSFTQQIVPA